jgi:hypothetical protein
LTIDPSLFNDKNYYYHNFKNRLGGRLKTRSKLRVGIVNPG